MFRRERRSFTERAILPLALVLSGALHGGSLFREKISDAIDALPRVMRKVEHDSKSKERALSYLQQFGPNLKEGKPLDLSLSHFYFENEVLAGGVSPEDAKTAATRFEGIVEKAREMHKAGKSERAVLNYILSEQGAYREDKALLTDLLLKGHGNCQARMAFISAATQEVFPEIVRAGELRVEIFGAYKDSAGKEHAGHVRAVIARKHEVLVLEGESVASERPEKHKHIPAPEVTGVAVTSRAMHEGLYDPKTNTFLEAESGKAGKLGKDEQVSSSFSVSMNSIYNFIPSTAKYSAEEQQRGGTADVLPTFLRQKADASKPITIEFRRGLTVEHAADVLREKDSGILLEFHRYSSLPPKAVEAAVQLAEKERQDSGREFYVRIFGHQKLPKEVFHRPQTVVVYGKLQPETLDGFPVQRLLLPDSLGAWRHLSRIAWSKEPNAFFCINKNSPAQDKDAMLEALTERAWGKLTLQGGSEANAPSFVFPPEHAALRAKNLLFERAVLDTLSVAADSVTLKEVTAASEAVTIRAENPLAKLEISGVDLPRVRGERPDTFARTTVQFTGNRLERDAFADVKARVVDVRDVNVIAEGAFRGSEIETLVTTAPVLDSASAPQEVKQAPKRIGTLVYSVQDIEDYKEAVAFRRKLQEGRDASLVDALGSPSRIVILSSRLVETYRDLLHDKAVLDDLEVQMTREHLSHFDGEGVMIAGD